VRCTGECTHHTESHPVSVQAYVYCVSPTVSAAASGVTACWQIALRFGSSSGRSIHIRFCHIFISLPGITLLGMCKDAVREKSVFLNRYKLPSCLIPFFYWKDGFTQKQRRSNGGERVANFWHPFISWLPGLSSIWWYIYSVAVTMSLPLLRHGLLLYRNKGKIPPSIQPAHCVQHCWCLWGETELHVAHYSLNPTGPPLNGTWSPLSDRWW